MGFFTKAIQDIERTETPRRTTGGFFSRPVGTQRPITPAITPVPTPTQEPKPKPKSKLRGFFSRIKRGPRPSKERNLALRGRLKNINKEISPFSKVSVRPPLAKEPQEIRGGKIIGGITNLASRVVEDIIVGGVKSYATIKRGVADVQGKEFKPVKTPVPFTFQKIFDKETTTQQEFQDMTTATLKRMEELDKKNPKKTTRNLFQAATEEIFLPILDTVDVFGIGELVLRGGRRFVTNEVTEKAFTKLGVGLTGDVTESGIKNATKRKIKNISKQLEKGKITQEQAIAKMNEVGNAVGVLSNNKRFKFGNLGNKIFNVAEILTKERTAKEGIKSLSKARVKAGLSLEDVSRGADDAKLIEKAKKFDTVEEFVEAQELGKVIEKANRMKAEAKSIFESLKGEDVTSKDFPIKKHRSAKKLLDDANEILRQSEEGTIPTLSSKGVNIMHVLSQKNLERVLQRGNIPNPSWALTKFEKEFSDVAGFDVGNRLYFVANQNVLTKSKARVFSTDAWTQRGAGTLGATQLSQGKSVGTKGLFAREIGIEGAVNQSERLLERQGLGAGKENFGGLMSVVRNDISKNWFGWKKQIVNLDYAHEIIGKALQFRQSGTLEQFAKKLKVNTKNIEDTLNNIEVQSNKAMTNYFEAKSISDVSLDDVVLVVPNKNLFEHSIKPLIKGTPLENRVIVGGEFITKGDIMKAQDILGEENPISNGRLTKSQLEQIFKQAKETPKPETFKGFEDLTLKTVEKLEGKSTVSKQFISDLTNSPDLKQTERELIRAVLDDFEGKVNVKEFADRVKARLLPLEVKSSGIDSDFKPRYESVTLPDDIRGNVADYHEVIYESPIKTLAGSIHYGNVSDNYFASTRIENMADSLIRRVIEIQSDLFQKGRLEDELGGQDITRQISELGTPTRLSEVIIPERGLPDFHRTITADDMTVGQIIAPQGNFSTGKFFRVEKILDDANIEVTPLSRGIDVDEFDFKNFIESERQVLNTKVGGNKAGRLREKSRLEAELDLTKQQLSQLQPYRNIWHERLIREEVKRASKAGKTKLQFPTGETAMKIEGLGQHDIWFVRPQGGNKSFNLSKDNLNDNIGKIIQREGDFADGQDWIITDVLGDGKFKAIPEEFESQFKKGINALGKKINKAELENRKETFDISGKIDTKNPIYRFYEKDVQRYLKNKYGAKKVIDENGVSWVEVDITKSMGKQPVEAFGVVAGFEKDEEGKLSFDPKKAGLGILGVGGLRRIKGAKKLATSEATSDKVRKKVTSEVKPGEITEPATVSSFQKAVKQAKPQTPAEVKKAVSKIVKGKPDKKITRKEGSLLKAKLKSEVKGSKGAKKAFTKLKSDRRMRVRAAENRFQLTSKETSKIKRGRDMFAMTDVDFDNFIVELNNKGAENFARSEAMVSLKGTIFAKEFVKVQNLQKATGLPPIERMNTSQLDEFNKALEPFKQGDEFLSVRKLETVDSTDLKGIKTVREGKERLAKELNVSVESLDNIKVSEFDRFRWDTSLVERNPFYKMMVEETNQALLTAEARFIKVEDKITKLTNLARKSRRKGLGVLKRIKHQTGQVISPTDKRIFEYLETPIEKKPALAKNMTKEELDLSNYMIKEYSEMRDYLIQHGTLKQYRDDYITHYRRGFLEAWKDDGLLKAFKEVFEAYKRDQANFNILDSNTGEILSLEKFFQFSLRRTGGLKPTQNVAKAFTGYVKAFEKKAALDSLVPKLDIYAHSLTPKKLSATGLELDTKLKRFVKEWINTKKGRIANVGVEQGGVIDVSIRGINNFVTMLDLGLNIPIGIASHAGEAVMNFVSLGPKKQTLGVARKLTKKGQRVIKEYKNLVDKTPYDSITEASKDIGDKFVEGLFSLFRNASSQANRTYLLGSMTPAEWKAGELSVKRLSDLKIEMGRWRVVNETESIIGATSPAKTFKKYKDWAIVPLRTTVSNIETLLKRRKLSDIRSREFQELLRVTMATASIGLLVSSLRGGEDEDKDKSFMNTVLQKTYRDAMTMLGVVDPTTYTSIRVLDFLADLGLAVNQIVKMETYTGDREGELKGVTRGKKLLTPRVVKQFQTQTKEEKARGVIEERFDNVRKTLLEDGKFEARKILNEMTEEEYEEYKTFSKSWKSKHMKKLRSLLDESPIKAVEFLRGLDKIEKQRMLKLMTEDEYSRYTEGKDGVERLKKDSDEGNIFSKETYDNDSFIDKLILFGKALGVSPRIALGTLLKRNQIEYVSDGIIKIERMTPDESQNIRDELDASDKQDLDHIVPLQLGGFNTVKNRKNLQLVDRVTHKSYTRVGSTLRRKVEAGAISLNKAQKLIKQFRKGEISEEEINSL